MSVEKVKDYFKSLGMEQRVWEFDTSSATVELAAETLDVRPARIAKTLSFALGEGCALVVAAGDARIDNPKFKERFKTKARMLAFDEVERLTGSVVGGVCPFALPEGVPVYLDESLKRFTTVFPACGSGNSAIELSNDELFRYSNAAGWVDVCKDWEPGNDLVIDFEPKPGIEMPQDGELTLRIKSVSLSKRRGMCRCTASISCASATGPASARQICGSGTFETPFTAAISATAWKNSIVGMPTRKRRCGSCLKLPARIICRILLSPARRQTNLPARRWSIWAGYCCKRTFRRATAPCIQQAFTIRAVFSGLTCNTNK